MNTIDKYTDPITFIKIVDRTIDEYIDDEITFIGVYAFYNCSSLTTVDLPEATSIGNYAFYNCSSLATVDLPEATSIGDYAFQSCSSLATVDLPEATSIGSSAFPRCSSLTTVNLPKATSIGSSAFYSCSSLTTVILRNTEQVVTLSNTNAFSGAENAIFYVPDSLVESYKTANNWSTYSDRIKGLSELPAA